MQSLLALILTQVPCIGSHNLLCINSSPTVPFYNCVFFAFTHDMGCFSLKEGSENEIHICILRPALTKNVSWIFTRGSCTNSDWRRERHTKQMLHTPLHRLPRKGASSLQSWARSNCLPAHLHCITDRSHCFRLVRVATAHTPLLAAAGRAVYRKPLKDNHPGANLVSK